MRRLFVSHSAKSREHQDYLRDVVGGLRQAPFEVFVDYSDLQAGDNWIRKISNHLVYCQAAVFLVSEQSLASAFVQHEISALLVRWRREGGDAAGDGQFPLVPILLSDVKAQLDTHPFWSAIRFSEVQFKTPLAAADAVEFLKTRFQALPEPDPLRDPLAGLEGQIQSILANATPLLLKSAAGAVALPVPQSDNEDTVVRELSRSLLLAQFNAAVDFVVRLGVGIAEELRQNLFDLLAPSWVCREAATRLEAARVTVVNGKLAPFTPDMYLRRWRNAAPKFAGVVTSVIGMNSGTLATAALRREICLALAQKTNLDPNKQDFETTLKGKIARRPEGLGPYVVAIPTVETDLKAVIDVIGDPLFAKVKFVLLCAEAREATKATYRAGHSVGIEWIEPELGEGQEEAFFADHSEYSQEMFGR